MKKLVLISLAIFTLTALVPASVVAQRRGADRFEQKAAKKSNDVGTSKAAVVTNAMVETNPAVTEAAPRASARSNQKSAPSVPAEVVGSSSPKAMYAQLVARLSDIQMQLDALSAQLSGLKGGKAKKLVKQIDVLQREKTALTAQKGLYPRSITDPDYAQAMDEQASAEYRAALAAKTAEQIAGTDPFAGKLSEDPELQKTYREYVDTFMPRHNESMSYDGSQKVYRVMFAISKKALNVQDVQTYGQVVEQRLPSGGMAYYVGTFSSRDAAQGVCNKILATGKYRDAFVVAMVGNKRVPL